jgi:hypothetical protein
MIDPKSGALANSSCPQSVQEYFIAGSEPTEMCGQTASTPSNWLSHLFGKGGNPPPPPSSAANQPGSVQPNKPGAKPAAPGDPQEPAPANADAEKKKGLLDKIFGIFGSSKKPPDNQKPPP